MAVATRFNVVLDCPEVGPLAEFYGALLGWSVEIDDDLSWANVRSPADRLHKLAFQRVEDYRPPTWPGQDHPQQSHLDLWVDDMDAAEAAALALGATKHEHQPDDGEGADFRVFLDPVGHPFCLCES